MLSSFRGEVYHNNVVTYEAYDGSTLILGVHDIGECRGDYFNLDHTGTYINWLIQQYGGIREMMEDVSCGIDELLTDVAVGNTTNTPERFLFSYMDAQKVEDYR